MKSIILNGKYITSELPLNMNGDDDDEYGGEKEKLDDDMKADLKDLSLHPPKKLSELTMKKRKKILRKLDYARLKRDRRICKKQYRYTRKAYNDHRIENARPNPSYVLPDAMVTSSSTTSEISGDIEAFYERVSSDGRYIAYDYSLDGWYKD